MCQQGQPSRTSVYVYVCTYSCACVRVCVAGRRSALCFKMEWIHIYIEMAEASIRAGKSQSSAHHGVFYAICQAAFYVLCFHHEALAVRASFLVCLEGSHPASLCHCHHRMHGVAWSSSGSFASVLSSAAACSHSQYATHHAGLIDLA